MKTLFDLKVKIFADGANYHDIVDVYYKQPNIRGFTTNPTLLKKTGVADYERFARIVLGDVVDKPISFEVIADDFDEMEKQARKIASWGENVYVKIPVIDTKGNRSLPLIRKLSEDGIKVNVTALMLVSQAEDVCFALSNGAPAYVSYFGGRVADTGRDPVRPLKLILDIAKFYPNIEAIWASPRELYNIFQADEIGCHIITVTNDILKKLPLVGKDLRQYSLETVQMFYNDAKESGLIL